MAANNTLTANHPKNGDLEFPSEQGKEQGILKM
jgi:hypothetical protein